MYAEKGLWGVSLGKWLKSATYKRTALADVERRVFCSGVDLRRCIFKYASTYFADIRGMGGMLGGFLFQSRCAGCIFWVRFNVLRRQRRHGGNEYTG
jgi:hypothetical protein